MEYAAVPENGAEQLAVRLQGQDDREIAYARVWYGDSTLEEAVEGKTVELQGTLDDVLQQDPAEYGTVHFLLEDGAGNVAEETYRPDEERPSVETFSAHTMEDAGEFGVTLHGADETALRTLELAVGDQTYTVDVLGEETGSIDEVVATDHPELGDAVTPFQKNKLTAQLQDWAGNETGRVERPYVRKYDTMDDTRLDIGAVYISQAGDGFRQHCRESYQDTHPAIGIYDEDPIPTEVTSKHIDQMTSHGITRLVYDYAGAPRDSDRIRALLDSSVIDRIEVEPFLTKIPFIRNMDKNWKDEIFPRDLPPLRDQFLARENAATYDGRPVVSTWSFAHFARPNSDAQEKVMAEFGSYETFVEEMRSYLRVDGRDPFLIVGKSAITDFSQDSPWRELVQEFDGATTWLPHRMRREDEPTPWDETIEELERIFSATREFTNDQGIEFIPKAFPGYNDLGSGCNRNGNTHIPRSPEQFRQVLELAEEYASADRIDIATWNDWTEGHQIEPGSFDGNNYGTAYLNVLKNFQQDASA